MGGNVAIQPSGADVGADNVVDRLTGDATAGDVSTATDGRKERAGTTSKYKGVQRHKKSGRWRAMLWRGELRTNLHLGYFESEVEAAKAYDEAARKYYGEDAWVNFEG